VTAGQSVRIPLAATDAEGDEVSYQLVSGPDWLKLEGNSLTARSSPREVRSHDVVVAIADKGFPPKTLTQKLTVRVVAPTKPPPPPPTTKFDHMKYAILEGMIERGGKSQALVNARTLGKLLTLRIGEEAEVDGVKFKVLDINLNRRTMEIEVAGGQRRTVRSGKSLAGD
jgi:hypothetical protein